jgi:hypothetical protein
LKEVILPYGIGYRNSIQKILLSFQIKRGSKIITTFIIDETIVQISGPEDA